MNLFKMFFLANCMMLGSLAAIAQETSIDVQHYQFQLTLTDASDTIEGITTIHIKFLKPTEEFAIDLKNISRGKGMQVSHITGTKNFTHANDKINIVPVRKQNAGDSAQFTISYKGIPADGLIISKNKFGKRTFFSDNWPNRAHNWLPCVDDVADKASVEFEITAPLHYQVISNGMQTEETNLPSNMKL